MFTTRNTYFSLQILGTILDTSQSCVTNEGKNSKSEM